MPAAVAVALTFGSFGDILEAARIAKRIADLLREGTRSHGRQTLVETLKGMHDDMSQMSLVFGAGHFTDRLWTEVHLCRVLLDEFSAKINSNEAAGFVAVLEGIQLHEVGEQLGRVASQVQYIGSKVDRVSTQVENIANVAVVQSGQISQMGSDIRQLRKISPHDITDPVFFVMDPLGRSITIQLSFCNTFDDLDRILKAYLSGDPKAGSRYVDRGDYNIISTEGVVISHSNLRGKVKAETCVEMSIIKRKVRRPIKDKCPQCSKTSAAAPEGSWVNCAERTCGARYQIFRERYEIALAPKATASLYEEISSPQISGQENQAESFRLVQIFFYDVMSALVDRVGDDRHIKRPENAFILFRRRCCELRSMSSSAQASTSAPPSLTGAPSPKVEPDAASPALSDAPPKIRRAELSESISAQWKALSPPSTRSGRTSRRSSSASTSACTPDWYNLLTVIGLSLEFKICVRLVFSHDL
ncbi:hypothetical protein C8J57DRAFT_1472103 [Mycena rebaudengoi]|nr:hypothetical protein C8J57DRAFT_1472103 [Mycena rebaudengoi]